MNLVIQRQGRELIPMSVACNVNKQCAQLGTNEQASDVIEDFMSPI